MARSISARCRSTSFGFQNWSDHWQADPQSTYEALRDNFCANVEAGAWILRQGLDQAHGDFWGGVGYYHSYDPVYQDTYLRSVLAQALRLEKMANAQTPAHGEPLDSNRGAGDDGAHPGRVPSWASQDDYAGFNFIVILAGIWRVQLSALDLLSCADQRLRHDDHA